MGRQHHRGRVLVDENDRYDIEDPDLEKYDSERTDSSVEYEHNSIPSTYSHSSRETSGSYQPMLPKSERRRKKPTELYKPPSRRTIRYLCLALFTTLLIFILTLIRASLTSSRQLEMGPVDKQPPKPPLWEDFPFLQRYFGGIRSLVPREENIPEYPSDSEPESAPSNASVETHKKTSLPKSLPFDPYPDYQSPAYKSEYGEKHECSLNFGDLVQMPRVHYYKGVPSGQPNAVMGSHDVLGLREDICFERFGRLGPYGYGYSVRRGGTGAGLNGEKEGADDMWKERGKPAEVDFTGVKWVAAQDICASKNRMRFGIVANATSANELFLNMHTGNNQDETRIHVVERREVLRSSNQTKAVHGVSPTKAVTIPRIAIVIRTWWDRQYSAEDIIYLRSMIVELSLLSGGEYTIQFLVHVRDDNIPIWADRKIYDRVLENSLPEEFQGMGILWSERQMSLIYGGLQESFFRDLPVHGVYRGAYMALQYFAHQNPKYEYLWNWEMDVRYTGHWYHLFDRATQWSKDQPRKGLWERNGRFYIPSVHGTWEDFKQMIRVQSEMGTNSPNNIWSGLKAGAANIPGSPQGKTDKPVWGPEGPADVLGAQDDPTPPTTFEKDKYEWGVGEEADFITFSPLFDPDGTTWFYVNDVTGYNTTQGLPPRRATIGTSSRLSHRLLQTMHRETVLERHHMFSEMWPASVALHHGYKAVYAPHPVYIDRKWPTTYLAGVMNGGRNGASGGARTSVYGGREHNFKGTTWFYDAGFAPNLWRRWLGYKVDNDGGEQEEMAGEGRMCLPGMLLHPVKGVDMVVEGGKTTEEEEIEAMGAVASGSELDWGDDD
ncbi:MAG: hypothetical protein ASARMPRED_006030 [Alectoria sarmentosa]|nr:MAG: hypothetical protein ASARMPRED_006030 [Alectoria sarmentosa]